jgi:hypothetical protein
MRMGGGINIMQHYFYNKKISAAYTTNTKKPRPGFTEITLEQYNKLKDDMIKLMSSDKRIKNIKPK